MLFPVGINQSFAQVSNLAEILDAPTDPIASDITIEILVGNTAARTITLPFSTLIEDTTDDFDTLTITFSILDNAGNALLRNYVGTNVIGTDAIGNDEVATVTAFESDAVTVRYDYLGTSPADVVIAYTVTDPSGRSDAGMITIKVSSLPVLVANPYTVTLALADLPTVTRTIPASQVTSTLLDGTMAASPAIISQAVFGDIGTGDTPRGESATGSDSGTLVVSQPSGGVRLVYTPATGFSGTETFDYTVTAQGKTASSQFIFVVPAAPSVAPIAPNHTVEVLIATESARVVTLPFSTFVSDATDSFDALDITFSIADKDDRDLIIQYMGTNVTGPGSLPDDHVALVESETVTIRSSLGAAHTDDVIIDYTVVDTDDDSSSGVITLDFVHAIGDITANPHTITLDNLFGLPAIAEQITNAEITDNLLAGSTLGTRALTAFTLTIGASDQSTPGALTFTPIFTELGSNPPVIIPATFTYTPTDDFVGTEIFAYTIDIDGKSATSEIIFVVPSSTCESTVSTGIAFGDLAVGATSTESNLDVTNTGNSNIQVMMKGAQWISVDTPTTEVMNVGQTKWSLTAGTYDTKTALTAGPIIVGDKFGSDDLSVYLQLFIGLINDSFRGDTTQVVTVTSTCD